MAQVKRIVLALCVSLSITTAANAKTIDDYANEAVERLSAYLQIDTINPPGNESRGVRYIVRYSTLRALPMKRQSLRPDVAISGRAYPAPRRPEKISNPPLSCCIILTSCLLAENIGALNHCPAM